MLRKEQRCCAEEHYTRRFPKAVQMAHYSPRQPHACLSLHLAEELDSTIAGGRGCPLSRFSSQNPIHPTSVPSSSSVALQMWNGVLGCQAGCDNGSTQSPSWVLPQEPPSLSIWLSRYTDLTSKLYFVSTQNRGVAVYWASSVLPQTKATSTTTITTTIHHP